MDPLSLSVNIIAVISAISSSAKIAKSICNAPEEIDYLLNDLTEAHILIQDIQSSLVHDDVSMRPQTILESSLSNKLEDSKNVLLELQGLVENEFKLLTSSRTFKSLIWPRAKRKTTKLRRKLAEAHFGLPRRLGQLNDQRIKFELNDIRLVQEQIKAGISRLESHAIATSQQIAHHRDGQEVRRENLLLTKQTPADIGMALQPVPDMPPSSDRSEEMLFCELESFGPGIRHSKRSIPSNETFPSFHPPIERPQSLPTSESITNYRSILIEGRTLTSRACPSSCRCKCHLEQKAVSPLSLLSLLGQLFIHYKALPGLRISCTDALCEKDRSSMVNVAYVFPQWWVRQRMMVIRLRYQTLQGPGITISFPRIVSDSSLIVHYVRGVVEKMKDLFVRGLASPNDLKSMNGRSILHIAVLAQSWPVVKFLTESCGADPYIRDYSGRNAIHAAWTLILDQTVSVEIANWLSVLFPYPGKEEMRLSKLHEAVLDIGSQNVRETISQLVLVPETINDQDINGRTPLALAVTRGDFEAAQLILEYGADPNIKSNTYGSPLHDSVRQGRFQCTRLLLEFGADPHMRDSFGYSLMHTIGQVGSSFSNQIHITELLQLRHIDLNAKTKFGYPVLFAAIEFNNYEFLRWLLAHDVDYKVHYHWHDSVLGNVGCLSILHYVGWFGSMEAINVVREAKLVGLDIDQLDSDDESLTPLDMFMSSKRPKPVTKEMIENFTLVLEEIGDRKIAESVYNFFSISAEQPSDHASQSMNQNNIYEDTDQDEDFKDAIQEQTTSDTME